MDTNLFGSSLSSADYITLFGALISLLIGLISICIAVLTLRQNSKMLEESTRPYVVFRTITTYFQDINVIFMVKNFGKTAATITDFQTEPPLSVYADSSEKNPFGQIKGSLIAPGQSHICHIDKNKIKENSQLKVSIAYKTSNKTYKDEYQLNLISEFDNLFRHASTSGKESQIISFTLQDYVERHL